MGSISLRKGLLYSLMIHTALFFLAGLWIVNQAVQVPPKIVTVEFSQDLSSIPEVKKGTALISGGKPDISRQKEDVKASSVPEKTSDIPQTPIRQKSSVQPEPQPPEGDKIKKTSADTQESNNISDVRTNIQQPSSNEIVKAYLDKVSGNIDKALDSGGSPGTGGVNGGGSGKVKNAGIQGDPLGGAQWSSQPRKVVSFPDIKSKIPDEYKKKGLSYSLTARIAFDKNGLAVRVDIISSSGDPTIDDIYHNELRKILVEPTSDDVVVEVTQNFLIDLK